MGIKCHLRFGGSVALLMGVACGPPGLGPTEEGGETADSGTPSGTGESGEAETTGAGSTDTGSTDTDATSTETGSTFVPESPDLFPDPCDPFAQDCPDGEKCVAYGSTGGNWDANKCVPVLGDGAPGEPCTYSGTVDSLDDCGANSFCWDVHEIEGEPVGTCTQFCTGTANDPECPAGHQCLVGSIGVFNLCIRQCDPIVQDCGAGLACYWANNGFSCIFTNEDIPAGEPCGFINDCAPGLSCLNADVFPECAGSACCSLFCDLELGDVQCESLPGTSCVPFFEEGMAPPSYEHVGVCILP